MIAQILRKKLGLTFKIEPPFKDRFRKKGPFKITLPRVEKSKIRRRNVHAYFAERYDDRPRMMDKLWFE